MKVSFIVIAAVLAATTVMAAARHRRNGDSSDEPVVSSYTPYPSSHTPPPYSSHTPPPYSSHPAHSSAPGPVPVPCAAWDAKCVSADKKCTGDWFSDACKAKDSLCCRFPLHCVSGVCAQVNDNATCTADADCVVDFYGTGMNACIRGRCLLLGNVMDACLVDDHCAGGMKCVKGKCEGLAWNATCVPPVARAFWGTTRYVCAAGLACSPATHLCVTAAKAGEACTTVPCGTALTCNKGTCVAMYSLDAGAECDSDVACSVKTTCHDGKCALGEKHSLVKCSSDADCKEGTNNKCEVCSHVSGQRYCGSSGRGVDCRAEWKKAQACYAKQHCAPVPSSNLDTCSQGACPSETNAVLSCKSNCWSLRQHYGSCAASLLLKNCPVVSRWTMIIAGFGILIGIILTVLIIFLIVRKVVRSKKGGYTPIQSS